MEKEELKDRISLMMKKNGITQKELANIIGVTEAAISRYVNGEREPKIDVISNMATALHTTTDYLLGREENDCIETEFGKIRMFVARNSTKLNIQQKKELIDALLSDD